MTRLDSMNSPSFQGFGCVLFDVKELEGRGWLASPGPGWASIDGERAVRIKSPEDLKKEILWLTNMDKKTFWESGCHRSENMKYSGYLRTELHQILREMGVHPKHVPVSKSTEVMSEVFARTLRLSKENYGISTFGAGDLFEDIGGAILVPDTSISLEVDEVMARAFQDFVSCERKVLKGGKHVTFRRPRRLHADQILDTPVPFGKWDFIDSSKLPAERLRLDWLLSQKSPVVSKVKVNGFFKRANSNVDVSKLLVQGEALSAGGRKKERNWMTHSEMMYLAKFAMLEIQAAFVAEEYRMPLASKGLPHGEVATHLSMSSGLLAENHWVSMASRSRSVETRSRRTLVSPRAAWLRSADRFFCFSGAVSMAAAGFEVTSYGVGGINVFVPDGELGSVLALAKEAGLLSPGSLYIEAGK